MSFCLLPTGNEDGLEFYIDYVNVPGSDVAENLATEDGRVYIRTKLGRLVIHEIVLIEDNKEYPMGYFVPSGTRPYQLFNFIADLLDANPANTPFRILINYDQAIDDVAEKIHQHHLWHILEPWVVD